MTSRKKRRRHPPARGHRSIRLPFSARTAAALLIGAMLATWMIANFHADRVNQAVQDADEALVNRIAAAASPSSDATRPPAAATTERVAARVYSLVRFQNEPLDTWPLTMIAFLAEADGNEAAAEPVRAVLLARTKRDFATLAWSVDRALQTGDTETALTGLDLVSRLNAPKEVRDKVFAVLVSLSADPRSRSALIGQLRLSPGWRQSFLNQLAVTAPPGIFPDLMQAVQDEPLPSGNPAWRVYLQRLVNTGRAAEAYALWVGLQPPERLALLGNVFDATFASPPDGTVFDWNLAGNGGVASALAKGEGRDGRAALRFEFSGSRAPPGLANQFVVLAPGSYRLSGQIRYEKLETERGLGWRISCVEGGKASLIGESDRVSGDHDWMPFLADFVVPPEHCGVQLLQFTLPARIPAEQAIRGRVWTDDLSIVRTDLDPNSPSR